MRTGSKTGHGNSPLSLTFRNNNAGNQIKQNFRQHCARRSLRYKPTRKIVITSLFDCADISESGIKLISFKPYKKAQIIDIKLDIGDTPLTLKCQVVWCKQSASVFSTDYFIGAQFVSIKTSEQLALRKYIVEELSTLA